MSFPVAVQSAVFYFVACTPCAKARHRQRAKVKAKKEREEKAKLELDQPGLYRQPSPFNTNPYWQEEIKMGPSLPKKTASKNSSQRGLTSSGRDSSVPSMSDHTNLGDSLTVVPDDDALAQSWNRRRGYQREDEELWGQWSAPGHKLMDAFSKARDSAGRLIDATLGMGAAEKEVTELDRREFYFSPRNPPVNEYHPPVVSSTPSHRDARKWMLQPPPPAKIMEGKVPVLRAASSASRSSGPSQPLPDESRLGPLTREKMSDDRLIKDGNPTETELIESLFLTRSHRTISRTRSRTLSLDSDSSLEQLPPERRRRRRSRRRPPQTEPPRAETAQDEAKRLDQPPETVNSRSGPSSHAAQRPKLDTIPSSDTSGQLCSPTANSTQQPMGNMMSLTIAEKTN